MWDVIISPYPDRNYVFTNLYVQEVPGDNELMCYQVCEIQLFLLHWHIYSIYL